MPPTINTFANDKKYLSETDARELECGTINEGYSNDAPVVSEFNIETKFQERNINTQKVGIFTITESVKI